MALRKILTEGDEQLLKHSRKVEKFDDRPVSYTHLTLPTLCSV